MEVSGCEVVGLPALRGSCSGIESTCYNEIHEIAIDEQEDGEIMLRGQ